MMSLHFYARPGPTQTGWREAQGQTAQMLCCHGNYLTLVQARLLRSHKEGTRQPCWLIKPIQGLHENSFSSPLAFPSADTVCVNDPALGLLDQRHRKVKRAQPTGQLQGIHLLQGPGIPGTRTAALYFRKGRGSLFKMSDRVG